jgi:RNA polymerase sigma factor (sigma-70 family)
MSRSRAYLDVAEVYRLHGRMVLRRARAILGDVEEARDALQELFMSLVNDPGKFRGESSIVTFLYRSTTNLCLNRLRDRQNRARLLDQRVGPAAAQAAAPAAGRAAEAQQLLAELPDPLARVVVYAFIDEMTQEEIADVMQCSRKHVGHLIERARRLLLDAEERCA